MNPPLFSTHQSFLILINVAMRKGSLRFIMSLRATGEGHLSSIVFRSGVLDSNNTIILIQLVSMLITPEVHLDPVYDLHTFRLEAQ